MRENEKIDEIWKTTVPYLPDLKFNSLAPDLKYTSLALIHGNFSQLCVTICAKHNVFQA